MFTAKMCVSNYDFHLVLFRVIVAIDNTRCQTTITITTTEKKTVVSLIYISRICRDKIYSQKDREQITLAHEGGYSSNGSDKTNDC